MLHAEIKRIFAILMALCLLLGMMPAGLAESLTAARAEATASPFEAGGSDDGEWLYRTLEDGTLEITGHSNPSAAALVLPVSLDGKWVTSIGENALADHADLASVTIPTLITHISGDAFPAGQPLRIRAYSGSAAMEYAHAHGRAFTSLSEYDFHDSVIDLSEMKSSQWQLGADSLQLSAPYSRFAIEDAQLYLPPCSAYANGLPVRITSVQSSGSTVRAAYEELDFVEAIESYQLSGAELIPDYSAFVPAEGVTVEGASTFGLRSRSASGSLPLKATFPLANNVELTIGGTFILTAESLDVDFRDNALQSFKLDASLYANDFELAVRSFTQNPLRKSFINPEFSNIKEKKLRLGAMPLSGPNLVSAWLELYLQIDAEGKVTFHINTIEVDATISWTKEGGFSNSRSTRHSDPYWDMTGKVRAGLAPTVTLRLGFGATKLSLRIGELRFMIGIEILGSLDETTGCMDASVNFIAEGIVRVGLLDVKKLTSKNGAVSQSLTIPKLYYENKFMNVRLHLARAHWESLTQQWQDYCSQGETVLIFFESNMDDVYVPYIEVTKGSDVYSYDLPYPAKDGFSFGGWYLDQLCTTPYAGTEDIEEGFTLYGRWLKGSPAYTPIPSGAATSRPVNPFEMEDMPGYIVTPTPVPAQTPSPEPDEPTAEPTVRPTPGSGSGGWSAEYASGFSALNYIEYTNWGDHVTIDGFTDKAQLEKEQQYYEDMEALKEKGEIDSYPPFEWESRDIVLAIPARIDGVPVTTINKANGRGASILGLELPSGVAFSEDADPAFGKLRYFSFNGNYCGCENILNEIENLEVYIIDNDTGWVDYVPKKCNEISFDSGITGISPNAFEGNINLTQLSLPGTIQYIGGFRNCVNLAGISLPGGIAEIPGQCFYGCSSLKSINIPGSVKTIGNSAFVGCSSLSSISLPNGITSIGDSAFDGCTGISGIHLPDGIEVIGDYAFRGCPVNMGILVLPDSLTELGQSPFDGWQFDTVSLRGDTEAVDYKNSITQDQLHIIIQGGSTAIYSVPEGCTSISIPDSVTKIGDSAFRYCSQLSSLRLPDGLQEIGMYAFENCDSLVWLKLPENLPLIKTGAFYSCENLLSVVLPEVKATIDWDAFGFCLNLKYVTGRADYAGAGLRNVFHNNGGIHFSLSDACDEVLSVPRSEQIVLHDGVRSIADYAFINCTFTSLELPDSLETIGVSAFEDCYKLQSIHLPDGLTGIPDRAFSECAALTEVSFGSRLESIGNQAFCYSGLTGDIVLPETIRRIGCSAFSGCALDSVTLPYIPDCSIEIGSEAFSGCGEITLPGEFQLIDESGYDMGSGTAMAVAPWASIHIAPGSTAIGDGFFESYTATAEIELPPSVQRIGSRAFAYASGISSIRLPAGVTSIGENAFNYCYDLEEINIPDSVTSIGSSAFYGCEKLKKATLSSPNRDTYAYGLFSNCAALEEVVITGGDWIGDSMFSDCIALKSVSLPSTITGIGGHAFNGCTSLSKIALPEGVYQIEYYAFAGCEKLETLICSSMYVNVGMGAFSGSSWEETATMLKELYAYPESSIVSYMQENHPEVEIKHLAEQTFTVHFETGGGTSIPDQQVRVGYAIMEPAIVPQKPSHHFTGWYERENVLIPWRFDRESMPARDITLYAGWSYEVSCSVSQAADNSGVVLGPIQYPTENMVIPATMNRQRVCGLGAECIPEGVVTLTLPANLTSIDPAAFRWATDLVSISIDGVSNSFQTIDGVLYGADGSLVCYPAGRNSTGFIVPENCTAIGSYAFNSAAVLQRISLPATIGSIAENAFTGCSALEELHFAADPLEIASGAIIDCRELSLFGPMNAPRLTGYADENSLSYNEYPVSYYSNDVLMLCTAARAGEAVPQAPAMADGDMRFLGWSADASAENLWDFSSNPMPAQALDLHAVWVYEFEWTLSRGSISLLKYTGDTAPGSSGVLEIRVPASMYGYGVGSIAGDAFAGLGNFKLISESTVVQGYAAANGFAFEKPAYTLSFESNGGSLVEPVIFRNGDTINLPVPQRDGYAFAGWYKNAALTQAWTSNPSVSGDLKLYADWNLVNSSAAQPFSFIANESGLTVTGYLGNANEVILPAAINGTAVTALGDYAFAESFAVSIVLPESISAIGRHAFSNSRYLRSVSLPAGLTALPEGAFSGCVSLTELSLPEGLASIGRYAFHGCENLSSITLPASLEELDASAFRGCKSLSGLSIAGNNLFFSCTDGVLFSADGATLLLYPEGKTDASYIVPDSVLMLGEKAMYGSRISSLKLGASVIELASEALCGSRSLASVDFSAAANLSSIGKSAFALCTGLTELNLPQNLGYIGESAFRLCPLGNVEIGADTVLASSAFTPSTSLTLTGTADSPAAQWAQANSVRFLDPAQDIEVEGISLNTSSLTLSRNLTHSLTATLTPADTTETRILWSSSDPTIASVDENGLVSTHFEGSAVIRATALNGAYAECTVTVEPYPEIEPDAIFLSRTYVELGINDCVNLEVYVFPEEAADRSVRWSSSNRSVAIWSDGMIYAQGSGSAIITATTSNGLTATCEVYVFEPEPIKALHLPSMLTTISEKAFMNNPCQLVFCPEGLTEIGVLAFANCMNLEAIVIPGTVTTIAEDAFEGCPDTMIIQCPAGSEAEAFAIRKGYTYYTW